MTKPRNRYDELIERIFKSRYQPMDDQVEFEREDIPRAAEALRIKLPKNLGDVIYSFRYRASLPESIRNCAPAGKEWVIEPAGRSKYRFVARVRSTIAPTPGLAETKIPDATPGLVSRYALSDEQALLARVRYNRLVDILTGVACYSIQNHLRTFVSGIGQVETDEIYVGVDRRGIHYVFPVQAKGGSDRLSIIQIEQDAALCREKFPSLVCCPIAAQFMEDDLVALFQFEDGPAGIAILREKHYRLVPSQDLTDEELAEYRNRTEAT